MPDGQPEIALVVATLNRKERLAALLTSLCAQTIACHRWELWIAVDGSEDGTLPLLEHWQGRRLLPLQYFFQENAGQAQARHAAILRSRAPRIAVVDDDMEVCPGFLDQHLAAGQSDPEQAVVIGKVVPRPRWRRYPLYSAVVEQSTLELHNRLEHGLQAPSATAFVTQNVSFPRSLYFQAGGFDASLRLDEDRELGLRLERAGGRFVFAPLASATHHSDVGSYHTWEERQYEYGHYAVRVWEKHGRDPYVHPLRNYVTGSRLNHWTVNLYVPSERRTHCACRLLRLAGTVLHGLRLDRPAIATHKGIRTLQYHLGVKHAVGSWARLRELAESYANDSKSPATPTGRGETMRTRST